MQFSELDLDERLRRGIADMGFVEATPIQADAIPPALTGRDVLGAAMTGSGKTAAYVLPILNRLIDLPRGTTRALVLTPTRELAQQVDQHLAALAAHTDLTSVVIHGGVAYEPQERAFRAGVDVVIATPGRLLDHMRRPYARLQGVEFLVLDEADRMLDMGFIPDIRRVLRQLPNERQTLLFSATMPGPIVSLSREMLTDPATINIERKAAPATGITQVVYPVRHDRKPALFLHLLESEGMENALGFVRTRERADRVAAYLKSHGVSVAAIHGDRTQVQRTRALEAFKSGRYRVLVATDVAARGLDLVDLTHVVNIDVPAQPEDYIHRVGRTARYEATGDAITFVAARELADLHLIEKVIGSKLPRKYAEGFDYSRSIGPVRPLAVTHAAPTTSRVAALSKEIEEERGSDEESRAERPSSRSRRQEVASQMDAPEPGSVHEDVSEDAHAEAVEERAASAEPEATPSRRSRRSRRGGRGRSGRSQAAEPAVDEAAHEASRREPSRGRKKKSGGAGGGVKPWWESPTRETEGQVGLDGGAVSVTETISAAGSDEAFDVTDSELEGFAIGPPAEDKGGRGGGRSRHRGGRGRRGGRSRGGDAGRRSSDGRKTAAKHGNGVVARFVELRESRSGDRLSAGRPPWPKGFRPEARPADDRGPEEGGSKPPRRGRRGQAREADNGRRAAAAAAPPSAEVDGVVGRFIELRRMRNGDRLVGAVPLEMLEDREQKPRRGRRGRGRRGGRSRGGRR